MKKFLKWFFGIIVVIILVVIVLTAMFWSSIEIFKGTEGISGKLDTIPAVVSTDLKPLEKGEADWISWQGVNRDSRSAVTGIKKDWSGGLKKLWEVDYLCQGNLSATWSAPVIQGNRLVVCGRDSVSDLVFCLDPVDGNLLWYKVFEIEATSSHGTGPRATPAIDDDRVYTFGRSGNLVCWNLFDGTEVWRANVMDEGGEIPVWGHSSSPLVLDEQVFVQGGGSARAIAFDKMTGKVTWKSGTGIAGYAPLVKIELSDKPALLAFHGKGFAAHAVDTGEELWNFPWETPYDVNATTPIIIDNKVIITSGYKTGCVMLKVDSSGPEILWQNKIISAQHSDPHIIGGYIYGYSGNSAQNKGSFKCVDVNNGTEKWTTNDMGWGTCIFVDDHLICCDIKGNIFLMKPDPANFNKVTELKRALGDIKGPVWTRPTVANGLLYLRFKQRLVCYDLMNS